MCLSTSIAFETENPMGVPILTTLLLPMYVTPPKYTHLQPLCHPSEPYIKITICIRQ